MHDQLLRDAVVVYADASDRVGDDYRSGTSRPQMIAVVLVGGVVFAGLIVTQVFAYKRTKRVFNLGLVLASVLLVAVVATSILRTSASQSDLVRARREGSDSVQLLAASRILALRAGGCFHARRHRSATRSGALEYAAALGDESGGGGLLAEVAPIIERNGDVSESDQLTAAFLELRDTMVSVQDLLEHRAFPEAETLVLGDQAVHAELLDQRLETAIADAQGRVRDATRDAVERLRRRGRRHVDRHTPGGCRRRPRPEAPDRGVPMTAHRRAVRARLAPLVLAIVTIAGCASPSDRAATDATRALSKTASTSAPKVQAPPPPGCGPTDEEHKTSSLQPMPARPAAGQMAAGSGMAALLANGSLEAGVDENTLGLSS